MDDDSTVVDHVSRPLPECPACRAAEHTEFFTAHNVSVDVGSVLGSPEEALRAPLGDIVLAFCHCCGLVWNRSFDSSRIAFKPGYDAALHHSPLVSSSIDALVKRLVTRFNLLGKDIVEIGCGSGYLLRRLCEYGGNRGIGIDPTVTHAGIQPVAAGRVELIRDFYSPRHIGLPCDFLCCQSVLEDISEPGKLLAMLRDGLRQQSPGIYLEVFNAARAFERQETWSIHFEQCNYFSFESLVGLVERCGLLVLDAGICSGNDQYLAIEAEFAPDAAPSTLPPCAPKHLPETLANFAASHRRTIHEWRERLQLFQSRERRVAAWGSGGKGVSFLNAFGSHSGIRFVVDINRERQGRFIPGTAQQIVPPAFLVDWRPDVVILTNPAYEREIRQTLTGLGLEPEIWHA